MTFRNFCLTVDHTLHAHLFYQATGMISRRIFEDRACALLRRLRPPAMLFILFNQLAQLLWFFAVKANSQSHDDFSRFNQLARRNLRIALRIKLDAPQFTKTTVSVAQIKLIVLVAPYDRDTRLLLVATASS